jgi:DNA primase
VSIPASFIQELISRTDVVDVVGRYVTLKKGGANFSGLCPFHDEKSPSFTVSPTKQFFHCFGCGKSGDSIAFLMEYAGLSFVEAVTDLAQKAGLTVPQESGSPLDQEKARQTRQKQATLSDVLEKAAAAYKGFLKGAPRAVDYFKGRGLSGLIAKRFGLGYAPEGWRTLANVFPEYDSPLLEESGLVIVNDDDHKRYDRFRDRVMFPIRNIKGECIGFGGRVLGDDKPKYLNSPETPVFSKGRELYGLFEARAALRTAGYVLVTEGYMDVVALAQWGFPQAVATLGTACTTEHIQKLFRFTDTVVFSFDGDAAGRRAARKALDGALAFASDERTVKFLFLPPEHDPDSFIREEGAEAFAAQVASAMPLSRFLIEAAREGCDLDTAEGRAQMSAHAGPMWQQLPDGALRRQVMTELATHIQLDVRDLHDLWAGGQRQPDRRSGSDDAMGQHRGQSQDSARSGSDWRRKHGSDTPPHNRWDTRRRPAARQLSNTRADHAARLLLAHMTLMAQLSDEQHHLLAELPDPHGALFRWLEMQLHEHGPLSWAALCQGLVGQPEEVLAQRVMSGPTHEVDAEDGTSEAWRELRDVLTRMTLENIDAAATILAAAVGTDPTALAQYRALQERRKALVTELESRKTQS